MSHFRDSKLPEMKKEGGHAPSFRDIFLEEEKDIKIRLRIHTPIIHHELSTRWIESFQGLYYPL